MHSAFRNAESRANLESFHLIYCYGNETTTTLRALSVLIISLELCMVNY